MRRNLFQDNDFFTTVRGRPGPFSRWKGHFPVLAVAPSVLFVALCGGCSNQAPSSAPSASAAGQAESSAPHDGTPSSPTAASTHRTAMVRDSRTRWIGDIPYDVWYDSPLEVYRDTTPLAGVAPDAGTTPMPVASQTQVPPPESTTTSDPPPSGDAATGADWAEIAPADVLIAETKDIRVRLTANLQTVAAYNKSWMAVANDGALLAAIAAVVERTPADINWKEKAPHIRELAYQIYSVDATGREQFEKAKAPFDQITAMLDGGPPPDGDVTAQAPFADFVSRGEMMKRIDASFTWLKSDVNTPTRLKEEAEKAVHEAAILRTLGTIFGDPSYEFSEEPEFQEIVRSFVAGNAAVIQAVQADDYPAFEAARNRIQSTCDPCHQKYRNAGN